MSHIDDDVLAAISLGELVGDADRLHASTCGECSQRLSSLESLVLDLGQAGTAAVLVEPPSRVWEAISAEVEKPASVIALDSRRPRRRSRSWLIGAVAASGVMLGVVGAVVGLNLAERSQTTVVAATDLEGLESLEIVGEASLEERADGSLVLVVQADYEALEGASYEVWLIDESIEGMISVGYLTSERAEFAIPAGFDVAAHPIVDISVEPHDGVPTHSGVSVTRGVLSF